MIQKRNVPPSQLELTVESVLCELGFEYVYQAKIRRWLCDFYLPEEHLVIEVDGAHWHDRESARRRDSLKNDGLRSLGVRVARISQRDVRRDPHLAVEKALVAV